jgi:hypothetical protein
MNRADSRTWVREIDPFRTAVAFAVISGALALIIPWLGSLTAALAALAIASWVRQHPIPASPRVTDRAGAVVAVACGAVGTTAFLFLPSPWSIARALLLGLSLLPLWRLDRRISRRGVPVR